MVDGILPDNLLVERVIAQKATVHGQLYLTKWRGLAYSETTWESEADLKDDVVMLMQLCKLTCVLDPEFTVWNPCCKVGTIGIHGD